MEKAIDQFQRTGKMPPTVSKFSIFRKEYFLGEFVPCLLRSETVQNCQIFLNDVELLIIEKLIISILG